MLILISMMIIVDRALYLRKAVMCKLVYQLLIVVFIHAWIFFLLPKITLQSAWNNKTAQVLYIVKCVYLLFSAWQIRNGYPNLCLGNLVTHAYGLSNMIFFKIFMAIPFLFELRTSIDWTWTDTSMPLFDFFNMENFYATIYNLKCARQFEKDFPAPRGVAKGIVVKYLMGLPMIAVLILIIWLPLLAFSLLNRIGSVLTPESARLSIAVEGYPPLYTVEARGIELESVTPDEFKQIKELFSMRFNSTDSQSLLRARRAIAFIDDYTYQDVLKVRFRPESENFWSISNDALNALKYQLRDVNDSVNIDVRLWFERPGIGSSKQPVIHSRTHTITLKKNSRIRSDLIALLSGSTADRNLTLARALPVYVIVPNEGEIKPAYSLLQAICGLSSVYECRMSSNLVMKLEQPSNNLSDKLWTAELEMNNGTKAMTLPLDVVKYESKQATYVQMVAFVDRVFPTFLTKYVQGGIVAMYIAVVLLVGKLIRGIVTNQPLDVIISEIPNPDFLLKICLDIYLVREAKDFVLEQDLFAKLIFLFRSPATLIKWTRYKVKSE
ncbi:hypothetical protein AB6A40_000289 [Gnathostoma spinigerum]|uniref:Piezo non-specific cation channel R-Ras-binding domain-containing protein n=1 Tax=Gnathostoma spinigerum TaxID=75299 RepID=A0ABD6E1U3_9BILA